MSFTVRLSGRALCQRNVAATDIKPYYRRRPDLRLPFEDVFAHFVWSADLGLLEHSVVASPLYTLTSRKVVMGAGGGYYLVGVGVPR